MASSSRENPKTLPAETYLSADLSSSDTPAQPAPSRWGAFGYVAFTVIWTASVISNVGTAMFDTASGWLITSLDANPMTVSLVQVAVSLPLFMFTLPAGALADVIELATATYHRRSRHPGRLRDFRGPGFLGPLHTGALVGDDLLVGRWRSPHVARLGVDDPASRVQAGSRKRDGRQWRRLQSWARLGAGPRRYCHRCVWNRGPVLDLRGEQFRDCRGLVVVAHATKKRSELARGAFDQRCSRRSSPRGE